MRSMECMEIGKLYHIAFEFGLYETPPSWLGLNGNLPILYRDCMVLVLKTDGAMSQVLVKEKVGWIILSREPIEVK